MKYKWRKICFFLKKLSKDNKCNNDCKYFNHQVTTVTLMASFHHTPITINHPVTNIEISWRTWKQSVLRNQLYLRGSYHTWEPGHLTLQAAIFPESFGYSLNTVRSWSLRCKKSETTGHHRFWPLSVRPNSDPWTCHYWL